MNKVKRLLAAIIRQRRLRLIAGGAGLLYLIMYLFALGDISFGAGGFRDAYLVPDALSRMFDRRGAFFFEAVAIISQPPLTLLIAPLNILIGAVLAGLVALNLALSILAWRQPRACSSRHAGGGIVAAMPGLFAGSACCAPTLLLVFGVQASAFMLSVFAVLIPAAFVLLLASAIALSRRIDTDSIDA